MTRVVAIIQARMTSTRLPGKVLRPLAGQPMLRHVLRRARSCQLVDEVVIATTDRATDDPVAALARQSYVRCFRGSENDVLARYAGAAAESNAELVVRITADCPLLDPEVTDLVIRALVSSPCDYASNTTVPCYPLGLAAEAFHRDVLDRMHRIATHPADREHVTSYVHRHPEQFHVRAVVDGDADNSDLRWTVDRMDDYELVSRLYRDLDLGRVIRPYRAVVAHVRAHPELAEINAHVQQEMVPAA